METRTYADLLVLIQALCGVDAFASNEIGRIKAMLNRRATKAFRATSYWPRYLVVGEERTVVDGVVPFEETDLQSIDTFMRIQESGAAKDFTFVACSTGAQLVGGPTFPTSVLTVYQSRHSATYGDGATETPNVPKEWFEYMAHGTYADFLRAEGQQEKAVLADAEAAEILLDELMRADEQIPSYLKGRVMTYANSQASIALGGGTAAAAETDDAPNLDVIFNGGF